MRAYFVHNPAAGLPAEAQVAETLRYLQGEGVELVGIKSTLGPGDATTYAREAAAQGCEALFLCGGDGTIAQAAEGLLHAETALATLPGGSGNVLARQLNLPVSGPLHPNPLLDSARALLEGRVQRVDVGRVTLKHGPPRHFLSWAGVGFDAAVAQTVEADPERKRQLRWAAFALASFLNLKDMTGTPVRLLIDGRRVNSRILLLVANNIRLYAIFLRMAEHAVIDDGCLDLYSFQGSGLGRSLLHAARLLAHRHIDDPEVAIYRARRIAIASAKPLPVHVDGDYVGETPATIECLPRALRLLVPPSAPATLFTEGVGEGEVKETPAEWLHRVARDVQHIIHPDHR